MNQRTDMSNHQIETYKSMIGISLEVLKLLALLNGGAAVALLAYLGNVAGKGTHLVDMRVPMGCYVAGLVLCGLAYFGSYLTQLRLFNEGQGRPKPWRHELFLYSTMVVALLSLGAFGLGSLVAAFRFK